MPERAPVVNEHRDGLVGRRTFRGQDLRRTGVGRHRHVAAAVAIEVARLDDEIAAPAPLGVIAKDQPDGRGLGAAGVDVVGRMNHRRALSAALDGYINVLPQRREPFDLARSDGLLACLDLSLGRSRFAIGGHVRGPIGRAAARGQQQRAGDHTQGPPIPHPQSSFSLVLRADVSAAPRTAVFTVVAKNYLAHARALMASLAAVHPDWHRMVVLADRVDGHFNAAAEPFEVSEAAALPLPDRQHFLFRYTLVELNTAVKPWCFRELFNRGFDRVLYLDPDIIVYAPLDEVTSAWGRGALAVLTPHLTGRLRDRHYPGERDILKSGTYNLGFLALSRHPQLDALLEFWSEKSVHEFFANPSVGLFTDQKWMDLVPGLFGDVEILRHEGYN